VGAKVADARSVLSLLLLSAVAGMLVEVEISGEDEEAVLMSITSVFNQ
jgi:phosphotransferase system HPr-like phosphotransfer protein